MKGSETIKRGIMLLVIIILFFAVTYIGMKGFSVLENMITGITNG